MTTMADELDFDRASRRIERILVSVAVAGTAMAGAMGGWKWAVGFLLGAAAAWFNFRWLKRLGRALGGGPAHSSFRLALRPFLFGGCAPVFVRVSLVTGPGVLC